MANLMRQALAAGETITTPPGKFFRLVESLSPVDMEFDRDGGAPHRVTQLRAGYELRSADGFRRARITSAVAQTVAVFVGNDDEDYDATVAVTQIQLANTLSGGSATVANTGQNILSTRSGRKRVTVQNTDPTAGRLLAVGDTTGSTGIILAYGQTVAIESTAPVYAISVGTGVSCLCGWIEEIYI